MNILWYLTLLYCSVSPSNDLQQELNKAVADICNQSTKEYQECVQQNNYNNNNIQPTYFLQPNVPTASYNSLQSTTQNQSNAVPQTYPVMQQTAPVYSNAQTYPVPQATIAPVIPTQSVVPITPEYSTVVAPVVQPTVAPIASAVVQQVQTPNPVICSPSKTNKSLSSLLRENPLARKQVMSFLEYSGVPPPWDQLLDFETTTHHQLPDPETLFSKIRKQLLTFDKVKTCIVEALMVIEKFINRGKGYLAEDLRDLCQHKIMLNNIMQRLRAKPAYEFRSLLFKRFAEIKCKIQETEKSFFRMKNWLLKIRALSKKL
ncbi:hypothetical protein NAPIS_ORF00861 [Vairimorpha apis BRL 01]|uniref:Uncharacterized protein n=1 Tax=Vairimorpha apis BRL 01 TaxID=1037528 RepID=T0LB99_9MICR|nr:hypothetical protein NAPIS_ORF00861 [Vairimorpha apis BRL 01]